MLWGMKALVEKFAGRKPAPGFAHVIGKDRMALTDLQGRRLGVDEEAMSASFVITTSTPDRVGDVVETRGISLANFRKSPVGFFNHQEWPLPIGKWEDPDGRLTIDLGDDRATGTLYFSRRSREAEQVFALVAEDILRTTSIAFNPLAEPVRRGRDEANPASIHKGYRFPSVDLLEVSVVGLPCQPEATVLRSYLSRGKIAGMPIGESLRKSLEPLADMTKKAYALGWTRPEEKSHQSEDKADADPVRWNRALSKTFDVANYDLPASTLEYEWVSKYIGCQVKELFVNSCVAPSVKMGNFLTALKHGLAEYTLHDVRNIKYNGSESPPVREVIQLNSKQRDDFLVDGAAFYEGKGQAPGRFVVRYAPTWYGIEVTLYTRDEDKDFNKSVFFNAWQWVHDNNFLKGEAFSLSGEFLPRTAEGWGDVFLEKENKEALRRTIDRLNDKGKSFANRGVILTGPPGTGKTLSGRIIRNTAEASFIWISSRDFHRSGSFGGLSFGFELARELAPSVLFIEDVDNWLGETTIDLIKTEMDGIARSAGVLTILTTNFPERLPEALIDRPGRFHDVLRFGFPTSQARREMLAKWLPELPKEQAESAVQRTDGYSGAHVYELAQFARALQESDALNLGDALEKALDKIDEQRSLIDQIQLHGSRYRTLKALEPYSPANGGTEMSRKWKKAAPKEKAVEQPTEQPVEKALSESGGAEGGYTVPEEEEGKKKDGEDMGEEEMATEPEEEKAKKDGEDEEEGVEEKTATTPAPVTPAVRKGEFVRKDADPQADPEAGEELPLGAQCLQMLIEHLQAKAPLIEQGMVRALYEEFLSDALSTAQEVYPGTDFGGGAERSQSQEDEEQTEEDLEQYRRHKPARTKSVTKGYRLKNAHMKTLKEAAEHMGDMGDMEAGEEFTRMHKAACRMHHKGMTDVICALEAPKPDEGKPDEGEKPDKESREKPERDEKPEEETEEKGLDLAAINAALAGVNGQLESAGREFYRLTGKRI